MAKRTYDRKNTGKTDALTRDDLLTLINCRRDPNITRDDVTKEILPHLTIDAYRVLTIKKINKLLREQEFPETIWVAYKRKVK